MYSSGCLIPLLLANPAHAKHARQVTWRAEIQNHQASKADKGQDHGSASELPFPNETLPHYRQRKERVLCPMDIFALRREDKARWTSALLLFWQDEHQS